MKTYPSIPSIPLYGKKVWVFDKLDGSNIGAEWSKKKGFWKFGRRNGLLDHSNPILLKAPDLILDKYGSSLSEIFDDLRIDRAIAYFEFYGPNSFAGMHQEDDELDVVLFDVSIHRSGFIPPGLFVKTFRSVDTPSLLYEGNFTKDIEKEIREGTLPGITSEGVVCKASPTGNKLNYFKVKTNSWLELIKLKGLKED